MSVFTSLYLGSQTYDWQSHGLCSDGTYIYTLCFNRTATGTICYISKINKSTMAISGQTKWEPDYYGAFQGVVTDGTYLYIHLATANAVRTPSSADIFKIACSDIGAASPTVSSIQTTTGGVGPQGIAVGDDSEGDPSIFAVFNYSLYDYGYISKLFTDLTYDADHSLYRWSDIRLLNDVVLVESLSNQLYTFGIGVDATKTVAYVASISQETSGGIAGLVGEYYNFLSTGDEDSGVGTGGALMYGSYDGSTYIWAVGWIPVTGGGQYGDVLLVALRASDLIVHKAWRIHHSSILSYRGVALYQDSTYVYLATGILPHSGLDTNEWESASYKNSFLRLNKSDLLGMSSATLVSNFSSANSCVRTFSDGANAGKTQFCQGCYSDGTYVYFAGTTTAIGNKSKLSAFVAKIALAVDKATGTLYDTLAQIKEVNDNGNVTVTPITLTENRGAGITFTLLADPAEWTKTVADVDTSSGVVTVDQTSIIRYIDPTGNSSININDEIPDGTSHYLCVNKGDTNDDTSYLKTFNTTAEADLYSHGFSDTPFERITKVEILCRNSWATDASGTGKNGVSWKIGSGTQRYYTPSLDINATFTDYLFDITSQTGVPTTWSDIQNMTFGPYSSGYTVNSWRCSKVRLKITSEPCTDFIPTEIMVMGLENTSETSVWNYFKRWFMRRW